MSNFNYGIHGYSLDMIYSFYFKLQLFSFMFYPGMDFSIHLV